MKTLFSFFIAIIFSTFAIAGEKGAKFDTSELPSIKVVYDWNLESPENVNQALNYISNHIKAYTTYAPLSEIEIAVVSHGPEAAIFAKQNESKFKEVVERMKSFYETYDVKFYVCNNTLKFLGFSKEDIQPFVVVVPAGVAKLAALQEEGYRIVPTLTHNLKAIKEKYGKKSSK